MRQTTIAAIRAILDSDRAELLAALGCAAGSEAGSLRLLTLSEAARAINVSRATVQRMCADGRLATVETRLGRRRVPFTALTALVSRGEGAA